MWIGVDEINQLTTWAIVWINVIVILQKGGENKMGSVNR